MTGYRGLAILCVIVGILVAGIHASHAFLNDQILAGKTRAPIPPQTISLSVPAGSCATGTAGVSCAQATATMSPSSPSFASDGGTYALVASGSSPCTGSSNDTGDFAINSSTGAITLSNASATAQVDTICVKAATSSGTVSNTPQYQAAQITVTSMVSGTCGSAPLGAAAADASAAGFTTCALYNDFTTTIPNTVGTGLACPGGASGNACVGGTTPTGNWMDCNRDSASTSLYYWNGTLPCSVISQATDGSNGTALRLQATASQLDGSGGPGNWIYYFWTQFTYNDGLYIELKYRDDSTVQNPSSTGGGDLDFWSQGSSTGNLPCTGYVNYNTIYQAFINQALEIDWFEGGVNSGQSSNPPLWGGYGSTHPNAATTDTNGNPLPSCPQSNAGVGYLNIDSGNPYVDISQVHTFGEIVTNDTNSNYQACNYLDGTRQNCTPYNFNNNDFNQERRQIIFSYGSLCSSGCNQAELWIYYVKIYTCSNWQNSNIAVAACPGTGNNGTIFTGAQ